MKDPNTNNNKLDAQVSQILIVVKAKACPEPLSVPFRFVVTSLDLSDFLGIR